MTHTKLHECCIVPYCRKKKKPRNLRCSMHIMREYRKNNPCRNFYNHLKWSAKKRGIEFRLTYRHLEEVTGQVKNFFSKTGLLQRSLTIDRIRADIGYVDGNIQVLMRYKNSEKYWATDRYYKFKGDTHGVGDFDDVPF